MAMIVACVLLGVPIWQLLQTLVQWPRTRRASASYPRTLASLAGAVLLLVNHAGLSLDMLGGSDPALAARGVLLVGSGIAAFASLLALLGVSTLRFRLTCIGIIQLYICGLWGGALAAAGC
ncbi:MAG: hypothetical protein U1E76_23635 [Planctomycetota bacterium]